MIKAPKILLAQSVWLAAAVGFNLTSIWLINSGQQGLINSDPMAALISLLPFAIVILFGFLNFRRTYSVLNSLLMLALFKVGVLLHITRYLGTDEITTFYLTHWVWVLAITINVYGVAVGLASSITYWKNK